MSEDSLIIALIVGCIVFGAGVGALATKENLEAKAVQTECAQFNPTTGDFEWIKPLTTNTENER